MKYATSNKSSVGMSVSLSVSVCVATDLIVYMQSRQVTSSATTVTSIQAHRRRDDNSEYREVLTIEDKLKRACDAVDMSAMREKWKNPWTRSN